MSYATSLRPGTLTPSEEDRHIWAAFRFHSRTFSFATRLLPRSVHLPVATLYLFCRTVDTIADQHVLEIGPEAALRELADLKRALEATLDGHPPDDLLWRRLADINERYGLASAPLFDLIDGATWDLEGYTVETEADLIHYADLVGGCIGAMMLPFLTPERPEHDRLEHAARALGIAMQITNITRDVGEDLRLHNRVYIPRTWLTDAGIDPERLTHSPYPSTYPNLMERMMTTAEQYYTEGMAGIDALPDNVRVGIRSAARMYREILNEVRRRAYNNLEHRAFVPLWRKVDLVVRNGYTQRRDHLRTQFQVDSVITF